MSRHHRNARWGGRALVELRRRWERELPLPCLRCGELVRWHHLWDLDHLRGIAVDAAAVWPAHRYCNRSNRPTPRVGPVTTPANPSRTWT